MPPPPNEHQNKCQLPSKKDSIDPTYPNIDLDMHDRAMPRCNACMLMLHLIIY